MKDLMLFIAFVRVLVLVLLVGNVLERTKHNELQPNRDPIGQDPNRIEREIPVDHPNEIVREYVHRKHLDLLGRLAIEFALHDQYEPQFDYRSLPSYWQEQHRIAATLYPTSIDPYKRLHHFSK